MRKSFASYAFGCRVNEAEKILIDNKLLSKGYIYNEENPEIFIINSCAVTSKAEHEARQFINQTRRKFPQTKIIVTGCAATQWVKTNQIINKVDQMIVNTDKNNIVQLIEQLDWLLPDRIVSRLTPRNDNPNISKPINSHTYNNSRKNLFSQDKFTNSGRYIVKIQDGCNRFCSYCIVPYLRGKPITRKIYEIIDEINEIGDRAKEIILTGINTEFFGVGNQETLPKLLDEILNKTKIERLSLGSIHPWSINKEFINWYKENTGNSRLVHFFHIPIQSGSDKILQLMNRGYTSQEIMNKLIQIHKINPSALIGTDIIVGFPEESDKEFNETYEFLSISPISKFHIFRYSPRIGTKAIQIEKQAGLVSPRDKIFRSKKLTKLGQQKYQEFINSLVGKSGKSHLLRGFQNNVQAALFINQIPLSVKVNQKRLEGTIENVIIESITNNHVIASEKQV
jgi:threonylcarbamoyladenosine tRNA methylthiotransferase MtaB